MSKENEDEEVLVSTTLVLHLNVGEFPPDRNKPEDFMEYLYQSDHTIQECEIKEVRQQ